MKIKDITIGEDYSVGYYGRGQVLETFVLRGKRRDGVRILMSSGYLSGKEEVFASRDVTRLWAERQAEEEISKLRGKIEELKRQKTADKVTILEQAFAAAGIPLRGADTCRSWGSDQSEYHASFSIESDDIELLIAALAG